MKLDSIRIEQCPICGCVDVVSETKKHLHMSGKYNETREWFCHYKIHFSPNLRKIEVIQRCRKDPKLVKAEKDKEQIVQSMIVALVKLGYKENKIKIRYYYSTLHKWNFSVNVLID